MQGQENVANVSVGGEPCAGETRSAAPEYGLVERTWLLDTARKSIVSWSNGAPAELAEPGSPCLLVHRACFVTLFQAGALRGCIGSVTPLYPLYQAVWEHACAAASRDPRFPPVAASEIEKLRIEISVLSEPIPISFTSTEELVSKLRPGTSGVLLQMDGRMATFLPQVWNQIPEPGRFLDRLAEKAGYPPDAWKWPGATISVYESESFEEPATGI